MFKTNIFPFRRNSPFKIKISSSSKNGIFFIFKDDKLTMSTFTPFVRKIFYKLWDKFFIPLIILFPIKIKSIPTTSTPPVFRKIFIFSTISNKQSPTPFLSQNIYIIPFNIFTLKTLRYTSPSKFLIFLNNRDTSLRITIQIPK